MCTGLKLACKDGSVVAGRTAEFGVDLDLRILFVPAGVELTAALGDKQGMSWTTKHAAVGIGAFDNPSVIDGFNDAGLTIGGFYFSQYAEYVPLSDADPATSMNAIDFSGWALGTCANIAELREAVTKITIADIAVPGWGDGAPPFHWIAYDLDGSAVVIEPRGGSLVVTDNPIGAMANAPDFDFHLKNLGNYMNLQPVNVDSSDAFGTHLVSSSQGTGALGLPGDGTSASRFVRAAYYSASHKAPDNAVDGAQEIFHLLNMFDIPIGSVQAIAGQVHAAEWTLATCARDPKAGEYYWRTYGDQTIRKVSLPALVAKNTKIVRIGAGPSTGDFTPVEDTTAELA
jgi:choloylglycine hydrolase